MLQRFLYFCILLFPNGISGMARVCTIFLQKCKTKHFLEEHIKTLATFLIWYPFLNVLHVVDLLCMDIFARSICSIQMSSGQMNLNVILIIFVFSVIPKTKMKPTEDGCADDEFTCDNGQCIRGNYKCDGRRDCVRFFQFLSITKSTHHLNFFFIYYNFRMTTVMSRCECAIQVRFCVENLHWRCKKTPPFYIRFFDKKSML